MFLSLVVVLRLAIRRLRTRLRRFVFGFIGIRNGPVADQPVRRRVPDCIFGKCRTKPACYFRSSTFMGLILERSGMAEDLLDTIGQLFGPIPAALAFAVIFVGAILGDHCVVAARHLEGLISPAYHACATATTGRWRPHDAASGTLAQIIPPSSC